MPPFRSAGPVRHGIFRAFLSYHSNRSFGSGRSRRVEEVAWIIGQSALVLGCHDSKVDPYAKSQLVTKRSTTTYGFARTSGLLQGQVRRASETRGFAQTRLLTHWVEIIGPEMARQCRPVEVSYSRGGFGATLVLLVSGALAPMIEMQKERLRERVNAVYGYNAIARIRLTQTAARGFAETVAQFSAAPPPKPQPHIIAKARNMTGDVADDELRQALERLAGNVISKSNAQT